LPAAPLRLFYLFVVCAPRLLLVSSCACLPAAPPLRLFYFIVVCAPRLLLVSSCLRLPVYLLSLVFSLLSSDAVSVYVFFTLPEGELPLSSCTTKKRM
jgi:hypothetical protein